MSFPNRITLLCASLVLAACPGLNSGEPADGTRPIVQIAAPLPGATVSSTATIDINAFDDTGVDQVRVYIDATLLTTIFSAPFRTTFNTRLYLNNTQHVIRVEAEDVAKNVGSAQVTVTVFNAPN